MRRILPAALLFAGLSTLHATPVTFATFVQDDGAAKIFNFINQPGTNADFNAAGAVKFSFSTGTGIPGLPTGGTFENRMAYLELTSSTASPAGSLGSTVIQPVISGVITIYDNTSSSGATGPILLRANFGPTGRIGSGGFISGSDGGTSASTSASEPTESVVFFSDFFDASYLNSKRAFAINLTAVTSPADGLYIAAPGDNFASFIATGAGTFSADHVRSQVPEPASMALSGMGLLGVSLLSRRYRRNN